MPNGVLPALLVLLEVRELGRDVLVDLAQRGPLRRRVLNGHRDQSHVTVRRFRPTPISIVGIIIVVVVAAGRLRGRGRYSARARMRR